VSQRLPFLGSILVLGLVAPGQQSPVFHADARIVPIYATVTGSDGRLVPGLGKDDFSIFEDGQPRSIAVFSNEPVPIACVAMWDVSPSMKKSRSLARSAAGVFVDALWKDDRLRFGTFSGQEIAFSPIMTNDKAVLARIVDEEIWYSAYRTPLWSALAATVPVLAREPDRRVLLLLSAGTSDLGSSSAGTVERSMQKADCMLYAVGLAESGLSADVREVALATGGGYAEIGKTDNLRSQFSAIVEEVHHQYLLGFVPTVLDGKDHRLSVSTRLPGAHIRARQTYFAGER